MYINLIELKTLIKRRQMMITHVELPFGSAIKHRRRELQMTLEEASENICSLSYLSKVENNLIKPNPEFSDKLRERLDLSSDYDYLAESDAVFEKDLEKIVVALLEKKPLDQEVLGRYLLNDYQSFIMNYAQSVMKNDYKTMGKYYYHLLDCLPSLPTESYIVTLLITIQALFQLVRYTDALDLIEPLIEQEFASTRSQILIRHWRLVLAFKLRQHAYIHRFFDKTQSRLLQCRAFASIRENLTEDIIYKIHNMNHKQLKDQLQSIDMLPEERKLYITALFFYVNNQLEEAKVYSQRCFMTSIDCLILHLMILSKLNDIKAILKIIKEPHDFVSPTFDKLKRHFKFKYSNDKEQMLSYFKRDVVNINRLTEDLEILQFFMSEADQILTKHHMYKDVVYMYRNYLIKINQMIYSKA